MSVRGYIYSTGGYNQQCGFKARHKRFQSTKLYTPPSTAENLIINDEKEDEKDDVHFDLPEKDNMPEPIIDTSKIHEPEPVIVDEKKM